MRLVERQPAAADIGQAVVDQPPVIAAEAVAPFTPDRQNHDPFARCFEFAHAAPRLAQDRGVEAAGEASVGGRDDDQVGRVLTGADKQRRRAGQACHADRERGQDPLHTLGVGPRRFGLLLSAAQPRGSDHLHRRGDLLGRPDAADAHPQVLQAGHRGRSAAFTRRS
jgi:hypothetical protein